MKRNVVISWSLSPRKTHTTSGKSFLAILLCFVFICISFYVVFFWSFMSNLFLSKNPFELRFPLEPFSASSAKRKSFKISKRWWVIQKWEEKREEQESSCHRNEHVCQFPSLSLSEADRAEMFSLSLQHVLSVTCMSFLHPSILVVVLYSSLYILQLHRRQRTSNKKFSCLCLQFQDFYVLHTNLLNEVSNLWSPVQLESSLFLYFCQPLFTPVLTKFCRDQKHDSSWRLNRSEACSSVEGEGSK